MWPPLPKAIRLAFASTLLAVASASAQTFVGVGLEGRPVPPPSIAAAPPPPAVPVPEAHPVMRFLPGTLDGLRLSGEIGDLHWPVFLTAAQATAPVRVRVGYLSAVSDLPDTSVLSVRINGRAVGSDAIDAARGLRNIAFDVPAGLLAPGYNALSISVQQRHRVDCSVAATYELWTRIEPSATGLEFPAAVGSITDLADLPALLPAPDGSMPVHIVLAGKTNPPHVQRLIRAVQAVALKGRFFQPSLGFADPTPDPYGVNLALGTRAALSQLPRFAGSLGGDGPLVRLFPAALGGRPTLVVSGSTDADVDAAIASLDVRAPTIGSAAGLLAAANYPARKIADGETLRLSSLGVESQEFAGRFFRQSLDVELPADFFASDYGRGIFDLAGAYASGLVSGAQVRVDVNGRSSGIIKLPYADGDAFRHNQLFLPLGLMRPGFNRVDIFAETPRAADATCAPSGGKRFLFSDTSELRLPALAHVERTPELAATTGGALPFTRGVAHLVVPRPDRDTMAAALSLTTRIAVAAGRLVPFTFATRVPTSDDGSTLVVSAARSLDPIVMSAIGLDPAAVEAVWAEAATDSTSPESLTARWWQSNTDAPAACRLPPRRTSSPASAPAPTPVAAASPPARGDFMDTWVAERQAGGWRSVLGGAARRLGSSLAGISDRVLRAVSPGSAPVPAGPSVQASLVLAQGADGSDGNATTIVTAPTSAMLRASVGCLFEPVVWSKVHGRLASLDASDGSVVAVDATSFHYRASKTSLGNARLVLAGWFSLNPVVFVLLALLTAACLSGTTLMFVRGVGRSSDP